MKKSYSGHLGEISMAIRNGGQSAEDDRIGEDLLGKQLSSQGCYVRREEKQHPGYSGGLGLGALSISMAS